MRFNQCLKLRFPVLLSRKQGKLSIRYKTILFGGMMTGFKWSFKGLTPTAIGGLLATFVVITSYQNCAPQQYAFESTDLSSSGIEVPEVLNPDEPQDPKSCSFNGSTIAHGQAVTAFLNSTESFGTSCKAQSRVCNDGTLSGSYQYSTCAVGAAASCLFNGQTIAHGGAVKAYQNSTVPFGSQCVEEVRSCGNGMLSGTYAYASCKVDAAKSCLFNGQTIAHGASVNAFQNSAVAFGATCAKEARVCNNGNLSGTYTFASCTVGAAKSCVFNGQTIAHGQKVVGYQASTVAFGKTCSPETRTCNNGVLSGSYSFGSCSVGAAASCLFSGQTVAHGQSVTAYQAASAATCTKQTRTCSNGTLSGTYAYASCEVPCSNPSETTRYLNSVIQIYKSESVQAIAQNCIDGAVPTLAANMPTDAGSTMRFKNTCGNRYCINVKGRSAGRVIDIVNGTATVECRYEKTPSTYVGACTKEVEKSGTPMKVISTNQSAVTAYCNGLDPSKSTGNFITYFYTCGYRYCVQQGYADGRAVELGTGGATMLQCYSNFMGSIVTLAPTPSAVASACVESNYPTISSNLPSNELTTERFQSTCGHRYCESLGYASGHVVEHNSSATIVKCLKK